MGLGSRCLWIVLLAVVCCLHVEPARAETGAEATEQTALGFSNLVMRIDGEDRIGIGDAEFRVLILEEMRKSGFNAVGAESLVFEKDNAHLADFLLGGTIRELDCMMYRGRLSCRIGILWELMDVRRNEVVYSVMTRFARRQFLEQDSTVPRALVFGALHSLLDRGKFRALVAARKPTTRPRAHEPRTMARCRTEELAMPGDAEQILAATVVVRSGNAMGSGFFVSPNGLLLSAAHVVEDGNVRVQLRDGAEFPASLVRLAADADVVLLRLDGLRSTSCLAIDTDTPRVGSDVYAIGNPAGDTLAFSLTRGIVSGFRKLGNQHLLQTDASINPGNSGGPLVDAQGRATAVVTWKVADEAVEGLAFGVTNSSAMQALGLELGDQTDPALLSEVEKPDDLPAAQAVVDEEDPRPSIDIATEEQEAALAAQVSRLETERQAAERQAAAKRARAKRRRELTPPAVYGLRIGGGILLGAGVVGAIASNAKYDKDSTTEAEFARLRTINDVSWLTAVVGGGALITSAVLTPRVPLAPEEGAPSVAIGVTGSRLDLQVTF